MQSGHFIYLQLLVNQAPLQEPSFSWDCVTGHLFEGHGSRVELLVLALFNRFALNDPKGRRDDK